VPIKNSVTLNKLPDVFAIVTRGAKDLVDDAADACADSMRDQIENETKSGIKYPGLPNQSSAPYQAPANQFGALLGSISVQPYSYSFGYGKEACAGDGSGVAGWMEFGTSKITPRPFMTWATKPAEDAMNLGTKAVGAELKSL